MMTISQQALPDSEHASILKILYILPNFFTTSSLFAGFYAIFAVIDGELEKSVLAIFIAMLFDTLEGRIARLTRTQSQFGAGYHSAVDLVSFGILPSEAARPKAGGGC